MRLVHNCSAFQPLTVCNRAKQQGVVLLIALIVLVALTLAGVALVRSVDTTNLIAGNMSFHESAVQAGERSTEMAIANWLGPHKKISDSTLFTNSLDNGYRAARQDPPAGTSWDAFWNSTLNAQATTGTADAAGNTVSYVIHRLCSGTGNPAVVDCSKPPSGSNPGESTTTPGSGGNINDNQVYYRITTRIVGPRSTVAYIQTIIAL